MNKKMILIIAAVLFLLGGLYYFFIYSKGAGPLGPGQAGNGGPKSLKDLLTSGVAQKCEFSTTDDSGTSEGVTYISGGKMRGDFSSTYSGKKTLSHMIVDGKTNYIWTDGEKTGFKTTIEDDDSSDIPATDPATGQFSTQGADLDQKADYKCSAWVVDGSYFTPPSNVTFSDLSEMFKAPSGENPVPGAGGGASGQCSVCDSLDGEDKTSCLSALGC